MSSVACGKRAERRSGVSAGCRTDARGGGAMQVESVRVAVRRRCAWAGGRGRRVRARGAPAEAVRLEVLLRLGAHLVRRVLALQAQAHGGGAKVRFGGSAAGGGAGATRLRGRLDYSSRQCTTLVYPPHAEPRILEPAKSRANQKRERSKKKAPRRGSASTHHPSGISAFSCVCGGELSRPFPVSWLGLLGARRCGSSNVLRGGAVRHGRLPRALCPRARAARAQPDRGPPGLRACL